MQHTLYKLSGVHMLLPSSGDIRAIRVTHVWVKRARLHPVTCEEHQLPTKLHRTKQAEVFFWTLTEETTRQLHVVFLSLSPGHAYELCLLRSVTIG
jgi:hypothetical protein